MTKGEMLDIISVVNSYAVHAGTNRDNRPQKFDYCDVMLLKGERWYDFFESVKKMIIESDNVSLSDVKTKKIDPPQQQKTVPTHLPEREDGKALTQKQLDRLIEWLGLETVNKMLEKAKLNGDSRNHGRQWYNKSKGKRK